MHALRQRGRPIDPGLKFRAIRTAVLRRHGHVVCLGEPMLCIAPAGRDAPDTCSVTATGSELLTACTVTRLGQDASLVTALPDSHLAGPVEAGAAAAGVSLKALYDACPLAGIATLHLPPIDAPAPAGSRRAEPVLQGVASSAFMRECSATAFCWPTLLSGIDVLHTSSSTLALGPGVQEAWEAAVEAADSSVAVSVTVDQRVPLYRFPGDEAGRREQRSAWGSHVVALAKAGRLSLLSVSAHDLDHVCSVLGVHRSGSTSSAQLTEQVEALALQLRNLRVPSAGAESFVAGPLVAVQFARKATSMGAAGTDRLRQKVTRWSTVAFAQGGSHASGSTNVLSATTEHVPVKYSCSIGLRASMVGARPASSGGGAAMAAAGAAAAVSIDQLNLGDGTQQRHDGRIGAQQADGTIGAGGDAAFVGGLLSALMEQGYWQRETDRDRERRTVCDLRAVARRGDITAGYAELFASDTHSSTSTRGGSAPLLVTRDRITEAEQDYAGKPAMLSLSIDDQNGASSSSEGRDAAETAKMAHGKGLLTGATHLPGFGGGSDLNALNPLTPGASVSSFADPFAMLRGFGAVAETVGLFSAGAAGAGLSKGLRDLDKIRTSLAAVASALNVSEQALLSALSNAVPELAKYVPLLSMFPGGGGGASRSASSSVFADTRAVAAPKVAPSAAVASQLQTEVVVKESQRGAERKDTERQSDTEGGVGEEQILHVASADDEMERVWRTESVSHAISRSRMLLPVNMPVDLKRLNELSEAGVTAVVLTLERQRDREEERQREADVVEEGRRLGICIGVEARTTEEMTTASVCGARFVLVTGRDTETDGDTGGVAGLLSAAAKMRSMRRMPIIPSVRDSATLDKLVSQHGVATVLWECQPETERDRETDTERQRADLFMSEIEEVHRDYGGTLRFIVGCDAATADSIASAIEKDEERHSASAAVLGVFCM